MGTINLTAKKMSKILSLTLVLTLLAVSFAADTKPAAKASVKVAAKPAAKASTKVTAKPAAKASTKVTATPAAKTATETKEPKSTKTKKGWQLQDPSTNAAVMVELKKAIYNRGRGNIKTVATRFNDKTNWIPKFVAWARKTPKGKPGKKYDVDHKSRFMFRYKWQKRTVVYEVIEATKFKSKSKPQYRINNFRRYHYCENAYKKLGITKKVAEVKCSKLGYMTKKTQVKVAVKKWVKKMNNFGKVKKADPKKALKDAAKRIAAKMAKKSKDAKTKKEEKKDDKKTAKVDTKKAMKTAAEHKAKRERARKAAKAKAAAKKAAKTK